MRPAGLSKESAGVYAQIEIPARPVPTSAAQDTYTSIGTFYDKLRQVLKQHPDLTYGPEFRFTDRRP